MKNDPAESWRYQLPCAFFDGENRFISELQDWRLYLRSDIVNAPGNPWSREGIGTSVLEKKWASEKVFHHELSGLMVMTFDIFDQGISYMIWWLKGHKDRKYGAAIKIGNKWRVVMEDEDLLRDFEFRMHQGQDVLTKISFKILDRTSGEIKERVALSRITSP